LELEEELKVVGNAMKSLEIFEQEVSVAWQIIYLIICCLHVTLQYLQLLLLRPIVLSHLCVTRMRLSIP